MNQPVLVDTGPLVAALSASDQHHAWVRKVLQDLPSPLWTCEAVLVEACHLLRRSSRGARAPLELLERGALELRFSLADHGQAVRALMERYADLPMSLADASLVRMSELYPQARLLTLDRDFNIYRRHGRDPLAVLMPPGS